MWRKSRQISWRWRSRAYPRRRPRRSCASESIRKPPREPRAPARVRSPQPIRPGRSPRSRALRPPGKELVLRAQSAVRIRWRRRYPPLPAASSGATTAPASTPRDCRSAITPQRRRPGNLVVLDAVRATRGRPRSAPTAHLVALTITNEINLRGSPNTSDGAYPRAEQATDRRGPGRPPRGAAAGRLSQLPAGLHLRLPVRSIRSMRDVRRAAPGRSGVPARARLRRRSTSTRSWFRGARSRSPGRRGRCSRSSATI